MKKRIISLSLSLLLCSIGFAQYNLSGKIFNAKNTKLLSGAHIKIINLNIGTTSNSDGIYRFENLEEGNYKLEASFIGFEKQTINIKIQKDTYRNIKLYPAAIELKESIVTATRTRINKDEVPAKTDVISSEYIEDYPATSIDDYFRTIPNLVVNRSWGVFSKNSSVTMRGMGSSSRTLIMMNGTPINKTAGGTIIWDMINPESIERIEIVKGPGSALYGNNAMGGVINIITKTFESKKIEGSASSFIGTYGYKGANLSIGQKLNIARKKAFWDLHTNYSKGDGYILDPIDVRNEYSSKAFLKEFSIYIKSGLELNKNNLLSIDYSYYNGKHGAGSKILQEDGSNDHYLTNLLSLQYRGRWNGYEINANAFTQWQTYDKTDESSGKKGYKLDNNLTKTRDKGLFINVNKTANKHRILLGVDLKRGKLDAVNKFFNDIKEKDNLEYKGTLLFYGLYAQDEVVIIENKLISAIGFRFDYARFLNGSLNIINPSSFTGFGEDELITYNKNNWSKFSPKVNLMWEFNDKLSIYASYATGFTPPKLDDMVSSRVVTKGYKKANPNLKPESITNVEIGGRFKLFHNLSFEASSYYSWAKDMVYFIETGEQIEVSGGKTKPVLQKQNISNVEIYGFESSLTYQILKQLKFNASYTFNHSSIKTFYDAATAQDFEGKYLIEVPKHQYSFSMNWKTKIYSLSAIYNYTGKQWFDDLNTEFIESNRILDIKASVFFARNISAACTIQNLFDSDIIDRKGLLSPGRFFLLELKYSF